jgi:integrase
MARSVRDSKLETRAARDRLTPRAAPYWRTIVPGQLHLGYRRRRKADPGVWLARRYLGLDADGVGRYAVQTIGPADDFQDADGARILSFADAQARAHEGEPPPRDADAGRAITTVEEAVTGYEAELRARGGDAANAARIRTHLPAALAKRLVASLVAHDFRPWRETLIRKELAPASINRATTCFKACLNLAADQDERITNRPWEKGLASIDDAEESRNVILPEPVIRKIIGAAYEKIGFEFGLLVEAAAVTGARISQLRRLEIQDLQSERADPRLMMPSARKGRRGRKPVQRRPVPIPAALAARLLSAANGRAADAPLLTKPSGVAWKRSDHTRLFARTVKHAQLASSDNEITIYALRHSNIVRQLLGGVPVRIVAVNHDTSVAMIERTYSRHITDHSDTLSRRTLLDLSAPEGGNVVPLAGVR